MALEKDFNCEGADLNFHRVRCIPVYTDPDQPVIIDVIVSSFASKEARQSGNSPLADRVFRLPEELAQQKADAYRQDVYNWLKTLPEFQGAKDV